MECNIIRDLIPLYIDECCSTESADMVKEHIGSCKECKELYEDMKKPSDISSDLPASVKLNRIDMWKASILQSVLLFISFALIIVGVASESVTPYGITNGTWAMSLIIPATGFMLSLANWYFVKLYKSRKTFSVISAVSTLGLIASGYLWALLHYDMVATLFNSAYEIDNVFTLVHFFIGAVLTMLFCITSKILSNQYAKWLGKE
ncbi:MAG: zf-HC2 domain-containing protein [Ruminococcus sp.]|nr:zf-HC2 domain-containing protein [Ruminococcus sp.]